MQLKDKVALVTGGAVRIGRAISLELAEAGCRIACHYNSSRDDALFLKSAVEKNGGVFHLVKGDLTRSESILLIVNSVLQKFARIDILINNAAIFFKTPLGLVKEKDWDLLHTLNLKSAFFLSQEVSRHMLKAGSGKIINIGDSAAEVPFPAYIPYSVTKAGIMALTRGLAKALAPKIQVNCINPGPVMIPDTLTVEEKEFAINQTLLKSEGSPADIAKTVRFLLEGSDYITGAIIPVDGGRQIR
ncbi:MAG: SDR family oxidoreductase [Calditrichaceae bacterium]|nr:SDR family oxidoreductase [Calditrichaceae bacterium]MBN2707999.1 SDR family oxidoreductase [Calditrichaceae bacterium]RQV95904.1 MAG: SDR family oxidoreductase [Calditrichota bacterium]HES59315.1 SDR family oxidoreductase [Caldithrix sp.]